MADDPLQALIGELLLYLDNRDATVQFDEIADRFYRETGFIRPGKSVPLEMAGADQGRRNEAWIAWCSEWRLKLISALLSLLERRGPAEKEQGGQ